MMDRPPHFTAGDFWSFAEPDASGGTAIGVWGLLAQAIEYAEAVLSDAGITQAELLATRPLNKLRDRLAQGSVADVALAVYAKAGIARAMLEAAAPRARNTLINVRLMEQAKADAPGEWTVDPFAPQRRQWRPIIDVEAAWIADQDATAQKAVTLAAGAVAEFAMTYAALKTLEEDLTGQAATGRRANHQRKEAAEKAAEVQTNHNWHAVAKELWADDPTRTSNSVALEIVRRFTTDSNAPDKSSVLRSIRPLIPSTSPSFKGG